MFSNHLIPLFAAGLLLSSCGDSDKPAPTDNRPAVTENVPVGAAEEALVTRPAKPAEVNFVREDFEGMGTIELPAGGDWKREGDEITNEKWGAVIVIQSQPQGMAGQEKEYLDSYNEMNVQDAPAWNRGPEKMGTLAGMKAARTEGSFNNGTAMKTRDYIFFATAKTGILQMRIAEENAAQLAPVADYMAGSFQSL
jgi:hypothetical protein